MIKITGSVCIEAPASEVWAVLSRLESIHLWVDAIQDSYCPEKSRGVGAVRVCELKQATIRETILEWEEGRSFKYRGEGAPMMKSATNLWLVEARGARTLVTSSAEVILKGGFVGILLQPLVRAIAGRLGTQSLAGLKYLVEHGHPHPGSARDLGPIPAIC